MRNHILSADRIGLLFYNNTKIYNYNIYIHIHIYKYITIGIPMVVVFDFTRPHTFVYDDRYFFFIIFVIRFRVLFLNHFF